MEAQNEILRGILEVKKENAATNKEMLVAKQQDLLLKREKFEFLKNKK